MIKVEEDYPHELGVAVIKSLDLKLGIFESIQESYLVFLDEILETCKESFARPEPELIPKTPSAKRSRRRFLIDNSEEDIENEKPPKKRPSIGIKKGRGRKKDLKSSEQESEADDESDTSETSVVRGTRQKRTATRTTAPASSTRSTRNTRARKNKGSPTKSPVLCLTKPATTALKRNNSDLPQKITKKTSGSRAGEAVHKLHTPKTPLTSVNRATVGSNGSGRSCFMSVKERASRYEEAVLSSGGTTPTAKQIGSGSRLADRRSTLKTPSSGKGHTPVTPSTLVKSNASIALSSNSRNSSLMRSASQIRKNSTQPPPIPTTPVSRNSSVSKPSSRTSLRRSLKLSASKRRSLMMRPAQAVIPEKDKNLRMSFAEETNKILPETPKKLRAKLTLKKTKVLRPKATRSKAKAAEVEEKMETDESLEQQSSSMSDVSKCSENLDKSAEVRRGTITLDKSSSSENQQLVLDGTENSDTINSLHSNSESMTETMSISSVQSASVCDKLPVKKTKVLQPKVTRTITKAAEKEQKKETEESLEQQSSSISDVGKCSGNLDQSAEVRRGTITLDKSSSSENQQLAMDGSEHSDTINSLHSNSESMTETMSISSVQSASVCDKLPVKKTKVLRPKATRSKAKAAEEEEKMETDELMEQQSSSMSDVDKSAEVRRGTITFDKSASSENQQMAVDGTENSDTINSLHSNSESMTETMSISSVQSVCDKLPVKKTKVLRPKATRSKAKAAEVEEKMEMEESLSSSMSDVSKCSDNLDKPAEVRRGTLTLDKSASSENQQMAVDGTENSDTINSLHSSSESIEQDITDSAKNSSKPVSQLSRHSSMSGRKHSDNAITEEKASLRPKRTARTAKNKGLSTVTSPGSSKTGKQRRSNRSSSRRPKTSNGGSSASDSDIDTVFVVPVGPAPKRNTSERKRLTSDTNESSDCESRGQTTEDEVNFSGLGNHAELGEHSSDDNRTASESDSDVIDRSLSPVCPSDKVVRPHPASFLNNLSKAKNQLFNLNSPGMKSFLRSSPVKKPLTMKEQQQLRKKDLLEKTKKEEERIQRRKRSLFRRAEEKRRNREEHSKKVQHLRMEKMKREQENKHKILQKLEHKNRIPEQILEGKRKENQEKKQIREQKHTEAEERRLQEDSERIRKIKEKEEEERQHAELLQRKRDFEEQERIKKIAEEKRRQEELQREMERKKKEEELKQIQLQQDEDRLRLKQQTEKEREQQRLKVERERKEAETRKQRERDVESELMKLKELEHQRKIAEVQRAEELRKVAERYNHLMKQQREMESVRAATNPTNNPNTTLTLPQSSATLTKSPQSMTDEIVDLSLDVLASAVTENQIDDFNESLFDVDFHEIAAQDTNNQEQASYMMTPPKKYIKKKSEESYDISGLRSDESTDDEDTPKRTIPSWAQERALRAAIVNQYYYPIDTSALFGYIALPDLNEMFVKKKARFNKRTSSANWDSPMMKGPIPRT